MDLPEVRGRLCLPGEEVEAGVAVVAGRGRPEDSQGSAPSGGSWGKGVAGAAPTEENWGRTHEARLLAWEAGEMRVCLGEGSRGAGDRLGEN